MKNTIEQLVAGHEKGDEKATGTLIGFGLCPGNLREVENTRRFFQANIAPAGPDEETVDEESPLT